MGHNNTDWKAADNHDKMRHDIIIVGAGAAGLMAGIYAAEYSPAGTSVIILEHMDKPGKKLLATGNGRCNYTNDILDDTSYRGNDPSFAYRIIEQYNKEWLLSTLENMGIIHTCINGYYYPRSLQAKTVVDCMVSRLESAGVDIICNVDVSRLVMRNGEYIITTSKGNYSSSKVIMATGGMSYSKLGSNGTGYDILRNAGHDIINTTPGLTGLKASGLNFKQCQGTRARCTVTIMEGKHILAESYGEVQFAEYGISGIPVFQVSRYASAALSEHKKIYAILDCIPDMAIQDLINSMCNIADNNPYKSVTELVNGYLPYKLAASLISISHIDINAKAGSLNRGELTKLCRLIKNVRLDITGDCGYEKAQVTAGGINTAQINAETMESLICSSLYVAGELLDIDGTCGGYNLHFAYATGAIAGMNAAISLADNDIRRKPQGDVE